MAYRIEQTGAELQGILNDAVLTKQGLEDEVTRAQAAEGVLQENIDSEAGERQSADALLAGNIGTEVARAQQAENDLSVRIDANTAGVAAEVARAQDAEGQVWDTLNDEILTRQSQDAALQGNIEREAGLREAGDGQLQGEIDAISGKIPAEASEMNQLADKQYVQEAIGETPTREEVAAIEAVIPAAASEDNELVDTATFEAAIDGKQDALTFDEEPTEGSENPVTSGGVASAVATLQGLYAELRDGKADKAATLAGYGIEDAYTKDAVDEMIVALSRNEIVVGALPQTGEEGVIYRVPGNGYYTDYMYYDGGFVELAQYSMEFDQTQVGYFTCDTAAGTAAKTVSAAGYTLAVGGNMRIKMTNANTADGVTLNINGTGAKALYYNGEQASADNSWEAGEVISVYYDGTNYNCDTRGSGGLSIEDSAVVAQSLSIHEERISEIEIGLSELQGNAVSQEEMKVIATALNELKDNEGGSGGDEPVPGGGVSGSVTVLNGETISAFGSSFGTGSYNVAGKNWIAKLSLFSDYRFENISFDGFSYYTLLYYTRIGAYVPTFHGKYALMACNENLDSSPISVKIRALDNICTYFRAKGVIPIIASSYCYSQAESAALRNYADKRGYLFWDETKYASLVKSGISGLGNGGFHLGTRDSTMVSDLYERGMELMEKPLKSIKIFRLRDGVSYENKDTILFRNNEERAVNFKELYIGTHCTNKPDGGGSLSTLPNEYNALINGGNVVFTTPALISCILPVDANDLTSLALSIRSSAAIRVFAQNRIDGTYPTSQTYTRFSVNNLTTPPSAGSQYSVGGTTYTVVSVMSGAATGYDYYIYCSPTASGTIGSGTLTKVSGDGPSSISFDIGEASALGVDNAILTDTVGHWVELQEISGKYRVLASDIIKCVDKDRIDFLITFDDTSCQLSQISVDYAGAAVKKSATRRYLDFESNFWSKADEIIPEPTFGSVGSISATWKDDNDNYVTSVAAGVSAYPVGCSSCVKVNSDDALNYTIPQASISAGGEAILELWCRFFPDVYTDGSGNQITTESYDYRNVCVQMGTAVLSEKVGLMWKIVRFPISVFAAAALPLRIYSDSEDGLEICRVSFKFKNC